MPDQGRAGKSRGGQGRARHGRAGQDMAGLVWGRRVVNSNLFSTDVGQWHVQDVKIQTGREDVVPFFILAFSVGAQKTRRTSMHVLHVGGWSGWLVLLP